MSEKNYRIRTNVGKDQVVRVNLEQDNDFLEILSLKIRQEDTYKLHVSNYGVIVGRVLANENFGIPNAKVSIFIKLNDEDVDNSEITNIYPYSSVMDKDSENRRYNLLPDDSHDDCYRIVGSFPNKRLVLDNNTQIEVFEKYWKYTTVTNKSGDYMIFGVPSGNQEIHVDIDLSDIGILSQKPIDFMYKGYNETQFDNPRQFKDSTNLDGLSQILSQNNSVLVYPFWGDEKAGEIAISRCDVQVQYKFEPTCVFIGSIISDNFNNNIGHRCSPSKYVGFNRNLVTGEGTIEMIRRTPDNLVEEFQIQGNRLIDGDGVWCYQIPMNLDFVGTDEFGNIVPTDDPKKGIATRTSVRFRVSMQETQNEGVSRHRAKYLIPNVQKIVSIDNNRIAKPYIESGSELDSCYEFGSATPQEYFRDLYWNKVYSVKNYIPRIQTNGKRNTQKYSAIRTVNSNGNLNPLPFNHVRFRLCFPYRVLCVIMEVVIWVICVYNRFISRLTSIKLPLIGRPFGWLGHCVSFSNGLTEDVDNDVEYFPCCKRSGKWKCKENPCTPDFSRNSLVNVVQQALAQEYDLVNFDFYNDWVNGSLYLPLWFWKKTKKKKFLFGLFSKKAVNSYCGCNKIYNRLRVTNGCSLPYNGNYDYTGGTGGKRYHEVFQKQTPRTKFGVIKEFENRAGLKIYYYSPGVSNNPNYRNLDEKVSYVRLYSTDIILLGSLNNCDLDNYPNPFINLPSTTANVPFISTITQTPENVDGKYVEGTEEENGLIEVTGMDWLHHPNEDAPRYKKGLLMDLSCSDVDTKPKSCHNVERISELGVTLDVYHEEPVSEGGGLKIKPRQSDGMITRYELVDNETRAMFASLNNNGLTEKIFNPNTGYYTYKLRYCYPIDFDGHMSKYSEDYTSMMPFKTYDVRDESYVDYRFGTVHNGGHRFFYSFEGNNSYSFPLFDNSFYFYFGLHDGNTAIDKFNKRFYSECYKHVKFPFTCKINNRPGAWCHYSFNKSTNKYELDTESFAVIELIFDKISTPYSYKLTDENNSVIVEENGLFDTNISFGTMYDEKTHKQIKCNLKYIKTGEDVKDKNGNLVYLENSNYRITIVDANGNSDTLPIMVVQSPITVEYSALNLGDKYYSDSECSDFCKTQLNGSINIESIFIDGEKYKIESLKNTSEDGVVLDLNLFLIKHDESGSTENPDKKTAKVRLTLEHFYDKNANESGSTEDEENENVKEPLIVNNIKECLCTCTDSGGIVLANGILTFNIWKPGDYNMKIEQYCQGEINDNVSFYLISILDGKPFNAYLNEMPVRFILGKIQDYSNYNKNFFNYSKSNVFSTDAKENKGWFNLHKPTTYKFSDINYKNANEWIEYTTVESDEEGLDTNSALALIQYEMDKMWKLSFGAYVTDDYNCNFEFDHSGGNNPILYRAFYPNYSNIDSSYCIEDDRNIKRFGDLVYDSNSTISCEWRYPNIIGSNYSVYNLSNSEYENLFNFRNIKEKNEPQFNYIYDYGNDKNCRLGNYFAVLTHNGGYTEDGLNLNPSIKYIRTIPVGAARHYDIVNNYTNTNSDGSIPYTAGDYTTTPNVITDKETNFNYKVPYLEKGEIKYKNSKSKKTFRAYLKGEFVDMRLDYDLIIFTPYGNNDTTVITMSDINIKYEGEGVNRKEIRSINRTWTKGRISGNTINGIEMAYDSNYNIVSDDTNKKLEYSYYLIKDKKKTSYVIYNDNNIVNKRYFTALLDTQIKRYDIRDLLWGKGGKQPITGNGVSMISADKVNAETGLVNIDSKHIDDLYAFDHSSDTKDYNGLLSEKNYPIRRLVDLGNINGSSRFNLKLASCSYEIENEIKDRIGNEEKYNDASKDDNIAKYYLSRIYGYTKPIGDIEFSVDCNNIIIPIELNLKETSDGDNSNVNYETLYKFIINKSLSRAGFEPIDLSTEEDDSVYGVDNDGNVIRKEGEVRIDDVINSYTRFRSRYFRLSCKLKNDKINTTHKIFTETPILLSIKSTTGEENKNEVNIINKVKNNLNRLDTITNEIKSRKIRDFSVDNSTVSEMELTNNLSYKPRVGSILESEHVNNRGILNNSYFISKESDKYKIVYDDESKKSKVIYTVKNDLHHGGISESDVLSVFVRRNYVNNSGDNLTKSITTFNFTSVYDVRDFDIAYIGSIILTASTTDVNTEIETPQEGGGESSGGETPQEGGGESSGGETPQEGGGEKTKANSSAITKTQKVSLAILLNHSIYKESSQDEDDKYNLDNIHTHFNQQFGDYTSISAIFKYNGKKTENVNVKFEKVKEIKNGVIKEYVPCIRLDIFFDGELKGVFLSEKATDCYLYVKMPNLLVYRIQFRLTKHGIYGFKA